MLIISSFPAHARIQADIVFPLIVFVACVCDPCVAFAPSPSAAVASRVYSKSLTHKPRPANTLSMAGSSTAAETNPRILVNEGMDRFRRGDVNGSIESFDTAEKNFPGITPYLWQRGLSYYYADRYQEGSEQFKIDVSVNPLDTEEVVWDIACQLRMNNGDLAKVTKMSLPKGKKDRRKIMATIYLSFEEMVRQNMTY